MSPLAPTLQAFFTDRLIRERVEPNTIAADRDTIRLLLAFASEPRKLEPSGLDIDDLDAPLIGRSRTTSSGSAATACAPATEVDRDPLAFRYAAPVTPSTPPMIERVLAIPPKRYGKTLITFPDQRGARRAARRSRSLDLDRPARSARCRCSPPRPGCAPQSSSASPSPTCTSVAARTSTASARAAYVEFDICRHMSRPELCCVRPRRHAVGGERACWLDIFLGAQRLSRKASSGSGGR